MTKYILLEDFEDKKKGTLVWEYHGFTYGCVSKEGIAVTVIAGKTPFFEVPKYMLRKISE